MIGLERVIALRIHIHNKDFETKEYLLSFTCVATCFSMTIWLLAAFLGTVYGNQCPENESHNSCGTACESICGEELAEMCIAVCVSGCFCDVGFIRFDGTCVPQENCASLAAGEFVLFELRKESMFHI